MQALPADTARLIASSQVITSVFSVVKELVENAVDANATSIEIKLENFGLDKVEVRDNGVGIPQTDVSYMARPHYTSKIMDTCDLERLVTYGFRGEALGSLCSVASVQIVTKTKKDDVSILYTLNSRGEIMNTKPSHLGQGTTVTALNLFKNLPVRKQFYNTAKKKKEELKHVEDLVMAFGIIKPGIRFTLRHGKDIVWQKSPAKEHRSVLLGVFGATVLQAMDHIKERSHDPEVEVEAFLPNSSAPSNVVTRSSGDRFFVFVNSRPVTMKEMEKLVRQYYSQASGCELSRYPLAFLHIVTPPNQLDVNLEPNKTRVLLHNKTDVLEFMKGILEKHYGQLDSPDREKNGATEDTKMVDDNAVKENGVEQNNKIHRQDGVVPSDVSIVDNAVLPDAQMGRPVTVTCNNNNINQDKTASKIMNTSGAECTEQKRTATEEKADSEFSAVTSPIALDSNAIGEVNAMNRQYSLLDVEKKSRENDVPCAMEEPTTSTQIGGCDTPKQQQRPNISDLFSPVGSDFDKEILDELLTLERSVEAEKLSNDSRSDTIAESCKQPNTTTSKGISGNAGLDHDSSLATSKDREMENKGQDAATDWSKGYALTDKAGEIVQPVKLLAGSSLQCADDKVAANTSTCSLKNKLTSNPPGQAKVYDLIGNCPVKRPTTSYIYFSKERRPDITQQNPGATFQEVAKLISDEWKNLSDDERQKYDDMMNKDVKRYKDQMKENKANTSLPPLKKRKVDMNQSLMKDFASPSGKRIKSKSKVKRKMVLVPFSMYKLQKKFSQGMPSSQQWYADDGRKHLIGQLKSHGLWVCHCGGKLSCFQPIRAQEDLIYRRLMGSHALPTETLANPMQLNPQMLGGEANWSSLLSMQKSPPDLPDPYVYYTDRRLVNNGFSLRQIEETTTETVKLEVVQMSRSINFFGVHDLRELLDIVSKHSPTTVTLEMSRPQKVQHYLQGEAVRMARQLPLLARREESEDLMDKFKSRIDQGLVTCFHKRPFLVPLYDMDHIPETPLSQGCSQSQSVL